MLLNLNATWILTLCHFKILHSFSDFGPRSWNNLNSLCRLSQLFRVSEIFLAAIYEHVEGNQLLCLFFVSPIPGVWSSSLLGESCEHQFSPIYSTSAMSPVSRERCYIVITFFFGEEGRSLIYKWYLRGNVKVMVDFFFSSYIRQPYHGVRCFPSIFYYTFLLGYLRVSFSITHFLKSGSCYCSC